jgi:leukotriene-A4 hydrolase
MVIRPLASSAVEAAAASIHPPRDPNTLSNYNAWRTKHTTANFEIDFEAKRLRGFVDLTLESLAKEETTIVLDTRYGHCSGLYSSNGHSLANSAFD